jgi:hypothetical protein
LETLCPQELRMTLGRFLACMHFLFWKNEYASYDRPTQEKPTKGQWPTIWCSVPQPI